MPLYMKQSMNCLGLFYFKRISTRHFFQIHERNKIWCDERMWKAKGRFKPGNNEWIHEFETSRRLTLLQLRITWVDLGKKLCSHRKISIIRHLINIWGHQLILNKKRREGTYVVFKSNVMLRFLTIWFNQSEKHLINHSFVFEYLARTKRKLPYYVGKKYLKNGCFNPKKMAPFHLKAISVRFVTSFWVAFLFLFRRLPPDKGRIINLEKRQLSHHFMAYHSNIRKKWIYYFFAR